MLSWKMRLPRRTVKTASRERTAALFSIQFSGKLCKITRINQLSVVSLGCHGGLHSKSLNGVNRHQLLSSLHHTRYVKVLVDLQK